MHFYGKLIFLWVASMATAQIYYADPSLTPPGTGLNYEQIAKIIQAPLFRKSLTPSQSESIPSYLPLPQSEIESKYDSEDLKSDSKNPGLSLVLEPPKPDAVNSYTNEKAVVEPGQIYPGYSTSFGQALPLADLPVQFASVSSREAKQPAIVDDYMPINPLSKQLDIPVSDVPKVYPPVPSTRLQLPAYGPYNQQFNPDLIQYAKYPALNLEAPYPTLSQKLETPMSESIKPKHVPTNLYPKKYNHNLHNDIPKKGKSIPVIEVFGDELYETSNIKKASKPQKFKYVPAQSEESVNNEAVEKMRFKFDEMQKKYMLKKENEAKLQLAKAPRAKGEQIASATGFETGGAFVAPEYGGGSVGFSDVSHGASGERTDFQMHGQQGPHSYKFGYDTGEGKNRQFRYEERDNDGYVKGHYGFYDKHGKLQVVNYDAHPHHGFHAEGSFGKA